MDILINQLNKIDKTHWRRIWCELNTWSLPKEFDKPEWWENSSRQQKSKYITPVMNHIKKMYPIEVKNYWIRHFTSIGERKRRNIYKKRKKIISKLLTNGSEGNNSTPL